MTAFFPTLVMPSIKGMNWVREIKSESKEIVHALSEIENSMYNIHNFWSIHKKLCQNAHLIGTWCCWKISLIDLILWILHYFQFLRVSNSFFTQTLNETHDDTWWSIYELNLMFVSFPYSIMRVSLFGDDRDNLLARWNLLQASWGVGKAFYAQNQAPLSLNNENPLCRFKAIGYR